MGNLEGASYRESGEKNQEDREKSFVEADFEKALGILAAGGRSDGLKRLEFLPVREALENTLNLIVPTERESQASKSFLLRILSKLARKNNWKDYDEVDYSAIRAELQKRGYRLNPPKTVKDLQVN